MNRIIALFFVVIPLTSAASLTRQQQIEVLNQGLRAFDRGVELRAKQPGEARAMFSEAAAKFQVLVDAGVHNGRLDYDLGNAYLQAGRLGEAIVHYRRAERLIPGDARLVENLRYARSLCQDQIPISGQRAFWKTLFFWHYTTPLRGRVLTALFTYGLFWLGLIGWIFWRRGGWWYLLAPCLALWLATGISAAIELYHPPPPAGVIVIDDVTVHKGNGEGFEPQFREKLHSGVEFTAIERRGDWLNIELGDGKTGWVRLTDAELL